LPLRREEGCGSRARTCGYTDNVSVMGLVEYWVTRGGNVMRDA
jgi:hypothetical protein